MTTLTPTQRMANAEMIRFWNELGGPRWVREQEMLDAQLDPVGELVFGAAAIRPGEAVLDIGCGCGSTTLEIARRVGGGGRALGVDISRPMLELARKRAQAIGADNVRFEEGDAQNIRFTPEFDLLFSRFGVMFFDDFAGAFSNMRGALKPGGRLAFVCWQALHRNPWMAMPLMAAMKHVMLDEAPPSADAPGPFALADAERIRGILGDSGYHDIDIRGADIELSIGGHVELEEAVRFVLELGPMTKALEHVTPELKGLVRDEVRIVLEPFRTPTGVRMPAAVWIVTANN